MHRGGYPNREADQAFAMLVTATVEHAGGSLAVARDERHGGASANSLACGEHWRG